MKIRFYFPLITFFIFSCKKEDPKPTPIADNYLSVTVEPTYGNSSFHLDSIYLTPEGYEVKFTDLKFYVSGLKNGTDTLSSAELFDFSTSGTLLLRKKGDFAKFTSLQGSLGVIQTLNHLDPSAFPNESPLNISNAGPMHWGWNPGYIFISVEGKTDTIPDGITNPNHSFSFHIGTDTYLDNFNFSNINWQAISDTEKVFNLKLDLLSFLQNPTQPINLKTEFLTHSGAGQEALALKVVQNFKQALTAQ